MAIATDEAGIQFRILNVEQGRRGPRDARAGRPGALPAGDSASPRKRTQPDAVPAGGRRPAAATAIAVTGVVTQIGLDFEARRGRADDGHVPVGPDPRRPAELRGRSGGGSAGQAARRASARTATAGRAAEDRHAAAARRPDDRFLGAGQATRATIPRRCSRSWAARDMHPRQVPCWITQTNARTHDIIRGGLDRSPLFTGVIKGVGPRYCPSIEDKVVRFAQRDEPPDLPRARRPRNDGDLSERHLDVAAVRRAAGARAVDARLRERRTSCGPAIRSNTTISIRARLRRRSKPRRSRDCSSPDRSTARPATKKRRRRASWPASTRPGTRPAKPAGARAATKPTSACSSTTSSRAASPSRTGCSRRAPSIGCSCAKTTPICV